MTRYDDHSHDAVDAVLDRAVRAMRDDEPDAETVRLAADRAWRRLAETARSEAGPATAATAAAGEPAGAGPITGCAGVRELIPALVAGELPPARRLLVEDHTRECVGCRRALLAERSGAAGRTAAAQPAAAAPRPSRRRLWLPLAAAIVALVGLAGWFAADRLLYRGEVATVAAVDGELFDVGSGRGMLFLPAGTAIDAGDAVRTAKGSRATLRLGDGSLVEMDERTELRVREGLRGRTVTVDRGAVIVEAADQRPKHLWVVTDEARVEVTGTIFAVEHGVRGSRVGVVEGEGRVERAGRELVLHPGEQTTSRPSLAATPVADQVAWSSRVDRYLALLGEIDELRREIARAVGPGTLRYASSLAGLPPKSTVVFVALPNPADSIAESWRVFRERLATSPALAAWWAERGGGGETGASLDETVARLRDFGGFLGEEIVIAVTGGAEADAGGGIQPDGVVVFSEVAREDAFRAHLEGELARIAGDEPEAAGHVVLVGDPGSAGDAQDALYLWIGEGRFVAATSGALLRHAVAAVGAGAGGFAGSELGRAVADAYADGTEWLFAADLGSTLAAEAEADTELAASGIGDVERVVVERWDEGERAVMSAELSFAGSRRGLASWLAAPAPIGGLDFVSLDAYAVAAFAVKEPTAMLDDLLGLVGNDDGSLAELEAELGLSLRQDVAAPLGGEVVVALDGPVLPEPSWKAVVEVYDPARLQHTLATAVQRVAGRMAAEGEQGPSLATETSGGRTFHRIAGGGGIEVHYTYVDGYLLAGPSRALLVRTLDQRAAGATLAATARFRDLLPLDARADVSALFYQHLGPLVAPLAGGLSQLGGSGEHLSDEQRQALAALMERSEPSLIAAYGLDDRVTFAGSGPGGPLGFGFGALSGFSGVAALAGVLDAAAEEQAAAGGS